MTCRFERAASCRAPAGFTLFELLVVLALMGLLLALASPRVHRALPGLELRSAAAELAGALRATRAQAIIAGAPRTLHLSLQDGRYGIAEPPADLPRRLPGGLSLSAETALEELDPARDRAGFTFFPDGTALGGRITLQRGEDRYRIDIDWLTGRVTVARAGEGEPEGLSLVIGPGANG